MKEFYQFSNYLIFSWSIKAKYEKCYHCSIKIIPDIRMNKTKLNVSLQEKHHPRMQCFAIKLESSASKKTTNQKIKFSNNDIKIIQSAKYEQNNVVKLIFG